MKKIAKSIVMTLVGTMLVAISINMVSLPNELGEGGVTGFTLFLHYTLNFNIPMTAFVANLILLILGWKLLDKMTIIYTLISVVALSFYLAHIHVPAFTPDNQITAPLVTGVLMGSGLGIVIRGGGSTGGTDIIALIINKFLGISVSNALLITDAIIVTSLIFVIGLEKGVISIIGILLTSRILNFWITGYNPKNAIFVISEHYEEIGKEIVENVKRGVTVFNGYGFYSGNDRKILYIVVSNRQLMAVQRIIRRLDPKAFMAVNAIQQVDGEGFTFMPEANPNLYPESSVVE
ncbi:YitT family protein [Facklamia sp. DSM 111018]|uniref:YitT family protein n=1 Tax=Facklamia lactis TaxID=2749967 RepID=A0ABS0LS35_9LACT|nr:YitT family protein [Facklamia lactis]MBG9980823.1 YitT family protein [Facklamia lactis]MBG9986814.1 YitT family protein [Facklamia lactis]